MHSPVHLTDIHGVSTGVDYASTYLGPKVTWGLSLQSLLYLENDNNTGQPKHSQVVQRL